MICVVVVLSDSSSPTSPTTVVWISSYVSLNGNEAVSLTPSSDDEKTGGYGVSVSFVSVPPSSRSLVTVDIRTFVDIWTSVKTEKSSSTPPGPIRHRNGRRLLHLARQRPHLRRRRHDLGRRRDI